MRPQLTLDGAETVLLGLSQTVFGVVLQRDSVLAVAVGGAEEAIGRALDTGLIALATEQPIHRHPRRLTNDVRTSEFNGNRLLFGVAHFTPQQLGIIGAFALDQVQKGACKLGNLGRTRKGRQRAIATLPQANDTSIGVYLEERPHARGVA